MASTGKRCTREPLLDGYCLVHFSIIQKLLKKRKEINKELTIVSDEYKRKELKNQLKKIIDKLKYEQRQYPGNKIPKEVRNNRRKKTPSWLDRISTDAKKT